MDVEEAWALEDSIWWAVGRRAILGSFLSLAARETTHRVVEIGCGSGGDLQLLARYGKVIGLERSSVLAQRARDRGVAEAVYDEPEALERAGVGADLFCMFDVLEHIEDDDGFISRLSAQNRGDHQLLITLPACQFLFGPHDELLHHYRRYSRSRIEALLAKHGYEIEASGYYMFFLFPLAVASRLWDGVKRRLGIKKRQVNLGRAPAPLNWIFTRILHLEAWLGRCVHFPIGLWIVLLAKHRPPSSARQGPG